MFSSIQNLYGLAVRLLRKVDWAGPLLVRLTIGLAFATNGWGKLHHLDDITEFFRSLNIPAPDLNAAFVSSVEFGGGLLLIAGLGTRIASVFLIGVMAVAIYTAKLPDLHGVDGLVELSGTIEMTYLAAFVWLLVSGAGAVSLDHLIARMVGRGSSASRVGVAA
jgi:putative oxidoreductase